MEPIFTMAPPLVVIICAAAACVRINTGVVHENVKPAKGIQSLINKRLTSFFAGQIRLYRNCCAVVVADFPDSVVRLLLAIAIMNSHIGAGFREAAGNTRTDTLACTSDDDSAIPKIQKLLSTGYHGD